MVMYETQDQPEFHAPDIRYCYRSARQPGLRRLRFSFFIFNCQRASRNMIDPSLAFETRRDNNVPVWVAPVMVLVLLEIEARYGRRSATRPGQEPNK